MNRLQNDRERGIPKRKHFVNLAYLQKKKRDKHLKTLTEQICVCKGTQTLSEFLISQK